MKYLLILVIGLISCKKNNCATSATCNDGRLEFGYKCDLCKDVGIKYFYGCDGKIIINC